MLLQRNDPKNPSKNKKMEKALESLKQLSQGHKTQQFDFFGETKLILGDRRLKDKRRCNYC